MLQAQWGSADLHFLSPQPDTSLHCGTISTASHTVPDYAFYHLWNDLFTLSPKKHPRHFRL